MSAPDKVQSKHIGDRMMAMMRFIDTLKIVDSSADDKAMQEASTRIKGIAARVQLGRSIVVEKAK